MVLIRFKEGRAHFRNSGMRGLKHMNDKGNLDQTDELLYCPLNSFTARGDDKRLLKTA